MDNLLAFTEVAERLALPKRPYPGHPPEGELKEIEVIDFNY